MTKRRRIAGTNKGDPLDKVGKGAILVCDAMERAVVKQMIRPSFRVEDVVDYLWHPEHVKILRAARGITRAHYTSLSFPHPLSCHIYIDSKSAGIAPPDLPIELQDTPYRFDIETLLGECIAIANRWANVTRIVVALTGNRHATLGRIKWLMPTFGSLLPAESAFHTLNPVEPEFGVFADIEPEDLRSAVNTIAEGTFACPTRISEVMTPTVGVQVRCFTKTVSSVYFIL